MTKSRQEQTYRGCTIMAGSIRNKPEARAFRGKKLVAAASGTDIPSAIAAVRSEIDALIGRRVNGVPSVEEFVQALSAFDKDLSVSQRTMLLAHCAAREDDTMDDFPDRTMTTEQLAEVAGYANYSAVNLQYGKLGRQVAELLDYKPPASEIDGDARWTMTLATGVQYGRGGSWIWTLRPEVAAAVERLGWA